MHDIIPYFFQKTAKMSQNLSSAVVVIGALRVKIIPEEQHIGSSVVTLNTTFMGKHYVKEYRYISMYMI